MPEALPSFLHRRQRAAASLCAAFWLACGGAAAGEESASVERGRLLLAQYRCGSCHSIPGVADARGRDATPLDGFGRRSYIAGRLPNLPDLLSAWIVHPQALVPSTTMPSLGVSAAQARDMAAYLGSLQ